MKKKIAVFCTAITMLGTNLSVYALEYDSDKDLYFDWDYIEEGDDLDKEELFVDEAGTIFKKVYFDVDDSTFFKIYNGVLTEYTGYKSNIIIPDNVTEIGEYAFSRNTNIKSVYIPNGVKKINNYAFANCTELTTINLPNSLEEIGSCAFMKCSFTDITIPNGIKVINYATFAGCDNLKNVSIPSSISIIDTDAFSGCTALESIVIPEGVETIGTIMGGIGHSVFEECTALKSVVLPNTLKTIGDNAFYGCSSLTNINIPDSVTRIGGDAFANCQSLKELNLPISLSEIDVNYIADKKYTTVTAYTTKAKIEASGRLPFSVNYKYQKDYLEGKPIPVSAVYYEKMTTKSMLEKEGKLPDEVTEPYLQDYLNNEFIPVSALRYYNWTGTYYCGKKIIKIQQNNQNITATVSNAPTIGFDYGSMFSNQLKIESNYNKGDYGYNAATTNNILNNSYDIPEKILFKATGKIEGTTVWLYPGQNYAVKMVIHSDSYGNAITVTDNVYFPNKNPFDKAGGSISGEYSTNNIF